MKWIATLFLLVACSVQAATRVYLHYASAAAGASIIDAYQELGGSGLTTNRWVRWRFAEYGSGQGWDANTIQYGRVGPNIGSVPGDSGWGYTNADDLVDFYSEQFTAVSGHVDAQADDFCCGFAHPNHEYNPSLAITVDSTSYTLGVNFALGQVIAGTNAQIIETSTMYGTTPVTDDYGTLQRTLIWATNTCKQSWTRSITTNYVVGTAYQVMFPANPKTNSVFGYVALGTNTMALYNGSGGDTTIHATTNKGTHVFYGGRSRVRCTIDTDAPVTDSWCRNTSGAYEKSYFSVQTWQRTWTNGETMGGYSTTITLDYAPNNYYIDSVAGNDATNGVTANTAWQTVSAVNSNTFVPGDSILFKRGDVWTENLILASSGISGFPITVGNYSTGSLPQLGGIDTSNSTYITIDGLYVTGNTNTNTTFGAIQNNGGGHIFVKNSTVTTNLGEGIGLFNAGDCTVSNCLIYSNGLDGVRFRLTVAAPQSNESVLGCTITNNGATGVEVTGSVGLYYGNITIVSNDLSDNQTGFYPSFATNCQVRYNYIADCAHTYPGDSGGIECEVVSDSLIEHNEICNSSDGVQIFGRDTLGDSSRNVVRYNYIHDNQKFGVGYGITINSQGAGSWANSNQIYYNLIVRNLEGIKANFGICLSNTVNNNVIANCSYGIGLNALTNVGMFITNNLFLENTNMDVYAWDTTNGFALSHNSYYRAAGGTRVQYDHANYTMATMNTLDSAAVVTSPLVNGTNDFRLQSGSPCINAGANVGLTSDYAGNPIRGLPDIGAYEMQLGSASATTLRVGTLHGP